MDLSFLSPVIVCILITETVERFAYFGFRSSLVLYFIQSLHFREETAIAFYAYVICLAYASPLLGAILADAYLGRFTTILWFGWIYAMGLATLTLGAHTTDNLQLQRMLSFAGLFLICMGTGGIKPCVSAFGADQVAVKPKGAFTSGGGSQNSIKTKGALSGSGKPSSTSMSNSLNESGSINNNVSSTESEQLRSFFSSFYFCINFGAVVSIAVIPIVRHRYGFSTAFLLVTLCVICAMLTFLSKKDEYVHHVPGQDGMTLSTTFSLCFWLIRKELSLNPWICRFCPCIIPKRSPLGTVDDDSSANQQLEDARQALRVLPIMCMFPIFWMLYDQQSSVWTLQATRMHLHGLQPEQLNIVNPVDIMIFIPLFDRGIYPLMESLGWNISHLRRMRWGMFLTATAFVISGLLETWIQNSADHSVSVFWQLPQITILAAAEVLLSVTGLEFAYSTSPERLKAFIMGLYLIMTAVGNFLGGLLYSSIFRTLNRATVMHICAILMLMNLVAFCWVGKGWERHTEQEAQREDLVEMCSLQQNDYGAAGSDSGHDPSPESGACIVSLRRYEC